MSEPTVGYCTNVHSGATLDETLANLDRYSVAVRERLGWDELPIGLWLSASAAEEALGRVDEIRAFLAERKLRVFTMNAFPYGDFHADVVKHAVYRPTWADEARVEYTLNCARLLAQLIPEGTHASISTLPIAWRADADDELIAKAGENLRRVAGELEELEAETERRITVDLEPEPGCLLDRSKDVVRFFKSELPDWESRRYIGVCHDICHAVVMFEGQRRAIQRYVNHRIAIGKVQVSSAVRIDGGDESIGSLRAFAEDRYLHQTCVKTGREVRFFDDLPDALAAHDSGELPRGEWRVHFHVPVHMSRLGAVMTTRDEVYRCLRSGWLGAGRSAYLELETYAWDVLPDAEGGVDLAAGIAAELAFVTEDAMLPAGRRRKNPHLGVWRDVFELIRISNLPTVWSNVLVGVAAGMLVGAPLGTADLGLALLVAISMSCFYAFGMVLNDICDIRWDRFARAERPFASGRMHPEDIGPLFFYIVMVGWLPLVTMGDMLGHMGWGLLGAIVLYNLLHKKIAASLVLMGACRALVVLIAAASTIQGISETAWWVASAVGVYTVLLTLAARDEESQLPTIASIGFAWMTLGVLPALWFGLGGGTVAAGVMGVICGGWLARSALRVSRGGASVGAGIMGLLSGFCLLDAYALMLLDRPTLALVAVGCFVLTTLGHRKVSGT